MRKWLWLLCSLVAFGQDLTLKQIMEDPYWMGELPSSVSPSLDGKTIYFQVAQPIPQSSKWQAYDIASGTIRNIDFQDHPEVMRSDELHHGHTTALDIAGDLWVAKNGQPPIPYLVADGNFNLVRFLDDHRLVIARRDNLILIDFSTGQSQQLTDLEFKDEPDDDKDETWYSREEKDMLDYVNQLYTRDEFNEARQKERRKIGPLTKPEPSYLGDGYRTAGLFAQESRYAIDMSPDQRFVAVTLEPEREGSQTEYANFINKEAAVKALKARPKVGYTTKTWKLAIVTRESGEVRYLSVEDLPEITRDPLKDIKANLSETDKAFLPKESDGPRPVMLLPGGFHPDSKHFLVTAYSRDYKDRWIFLVDAETMETELIQHHYDEAWVPHILRSVASPYVSGAAFWAQNGQKVAFLSDHSGYQHLYTYSLQDKSLKAMTKGEFEVHSPFESRDGKWWYFHSSQTHPGNIHFYKMPMEGGEAAPLTSGDGHHFVTIGPDGKTMAALFSETNRPPHLMVPDGPGKWKEAYDGRSEAFKAIDWAKPEVLSYTNRDGKPVFARLYKPEKANGAGVVFVHGAGYLQNAHKGWSSYFREYMFHNLLMRQGFTVLDPDYQASAGYGRDWRTAIYRHMGGADLNDIVDGAEFLASQPGVQKGKLGVYGGSYGGFMTLMAMFTTPEVFQSGAALRPVTDWAYYNHWYTSRILNTPFDDPEAYRRSSPIYFADGLKGHLLIAHGMVDSNVHYQDSVRLAQKLIELRKHNWELSSYPVEPHGFRTPTSWYDEYRRIYELFQDTLQ